MVEQGATAPGGQAGDTGDAGQIGGFGFTRDQVTAFAAGLYSLAACDGVDDREVAIIKEFVSDAGYAELGERLASLSFDPVEAYRLFESSWLRGLFLRASLLVIKSDGAVSDGEVEMLDFLTEAFGVPGGYEGLLARVEGESLS